MLYEAARVNDAAVWRAVAKTLEKPAKNWAEVNVGKVASHLNEGEIALVPGKVLGMGEPGKVEIAAWKFSKVARDKVEQAGGSCYTISELIRKDPKGGNIRIIGG
jgi:large subunit ribosomal protein L18e